MRKNPLVLVLFGATALAVVCFAQDANINSVIGNVLLQNSTPGTVQAGHATISGTFRAGQINATQGSPATISVIGNNTAVGAGAAIGGSFSSGQSSGIAVRGTVTASAGPAVGVLGTSRSEFGAGVKGINSAPVAGASQTSAGVFAEANSINVPALRATNANGIAVRATSSGAGLPAIDAVNSSSGSGFGIETQGDTGIRSRGKVGVDSECDAGGSSAGFFNSLRTNGSGVVGEIDNGNGGTGTALYGINPNGGGWAVFAQGNIGASGTKSFSIDHPLDPENKTLNHYCTEGEEPLNVYRGKVKTDHEGRATVKLPAYFEAINTAPTVQLTVEDSSDDFVIAKVSRPVSGGSFQIRTSKPGTTVDWRVEARRNDRWVQKHGAPVETDKPEYMKGHYIDPELYGLPASKGRLAAVKSSKPGAALLNLGRP